MSQANKKNFLADVFANTESQTSHIEYPRHIRKPQFFVVCVIELLANIYSMLFTYQEA